MKPRQLWSLSLFVFVSTSVAAPRDQWTVVERGPHHKAMEQVVRQPLLDGTLSEKKLRRVDLATGLHYWENGQWIEAREAIEPAPHGAVGSYGQVKVAFAANLN